MYELIRASAGSGKTFQLSGHFLRQLFEGHAPETILATTFTRKAAGEILGRVLLRLAAAAESAKESTLLGEFLSPVEVTADKALELLVQVTGQLHRMRVCTLDSFFQQVARSLTLELGLQPGWNIIDEHADRELRQRAIDAVLAQQMPKDAQRLMQMLAKGRSKRSVRDLIGDTVKQFHDLYLLTDSDAWNKVPRPKRLTQKEINQAVREVNAETTYSDKRLVKAVREDLERFEAGQWETFIDKGIAGKVFQSDHTYYRKPIAEGLVNAYQLLLRHATAEILGMVAQQTKATYDLIQRFDTEYIRLRAEHGWLGFGDVTRVLARSQGAASGDRMNFRLDSVLKHLLLDEFQDTSPDQWSILKRLAMSVTKSEESTFFCVGDPKQAIYGWRGGVAEILDAVESSIPDIESRSLDQSRRSSVAVIDTVNHVFKHLNEHNNLNEFGAACFDWQTAFPSHTTFHSDLPGYAQLRTSPDFEGDSAEERRGPYYSWAAEQIQHLHQTCPGAEIGVLARKNHTVARLVHELTLLGVPASEEGGTAPTDSPAVLAVLSLLHLASHPGCTISRFHVATSPLAGLVELTSWDDDVAAARTAEEIRTRLIDDGYGPTLQWLSESVRHNCSQRDTVRLRQVVAEGWKFDQSPSLNASDFVAMLENSKLSKTEIASVRVMTVHQSKGLEFDIVVLPELDGKLFRPPSAAARSSEPGMSPDEVCVWRNKSVRSLLPKSLQEAFDQTVARDVSEALCLLYVALTRAVHSLHMLIPPVNSKRIPASFSGVLLASLTEDQNAPENTVLYESGTADWFIDQPNMAAPRSSDKAPRSAQNRSATVISLANMQRRNRGLRREAPSHHEETRLRVSSFRREHGSDTLVPLDVDAKTRGTLIHAWFEEIAWFDDRSLPSDERLMEVARGFHLSLESQKRLIEEFREMLQKPNTQRAMSRKGTLSLPAFESFSGQVMAGEVELRVENERPFVLMRGGALVQGTIDRIVLAVRKGKVIAADIVDFKTDAVFGEEQDWVHAKTRHYDSQLAAYEAAVHQCFQVPKQMIASRLILLEPDVVAAKRS